MSGFITEVNCSGVWKEKKSVRRSLTWLCTASLRACGQGHVAHSEQERTEHEVTHLLFGSECNDPITCAGNGYAEDL